MWLAIPLHTSQHPLGHPTTCLHRNPYFGTAERARQLYESLQNGNPERKDFIRKLIFGEGSSTDITNWPDPHLVPSILRLARNVEVVGVDGLHHVDLDDFRSALRSCTKLSELRACGELIENFPFLSYSSDWTADPSIITG